MTQEQKIQQLIEPSLNDMGYEIIRVQIQGGRTRPILQIMAEKSSDGTMNIDDCAKVSRTISTILEVEDPIADAYNLEVSSPGIDRPLTRLKDFETFVGFEARIDAENILHGRKRFRGVLKGVQGNNILLLSDDVNLGEIEIPFTNLEKAKLVLTDALIEAFAPTGERLDEQEQTEGEE